MSSHKISRARSRSPRDHCDPDRRHHDRRRSPKRLHRHETSKDVQVVLPYNQHPLSKNDLNRHKSIFANYLNIQKGIDIRDLDEKEVKGRWKSFLGKWNRAELARGWYDPDTISRAGEQQLTPQPVKVSREPSPRRSFSEDEYGPSLPATSGRKHGPAIPGFQDLQHKHEVDQEDRAARLSQAKVERKAERKLHTERMDEIAPRAEAGTRDRQLEKKRDLAASNKAFAQSKESDAVEVSDADLLGGEEGIAAYKAKLKAQQRQKNEREIRKEEVLRARAAEREERLAVHRNKEAKTMATLRALAEQRFGGS